MSIKVNPGWQIDKTSAFDGWNASGTTKFQDNYLKNLIRECFQNSLDAKVENSDEPVRVRIEKLEYDIADIIPNFQEYKNHVIAACTEAQKDNPATQADAKRALKCLEDSENKKIQVLRIRDFNTVGLQGVKKDRERFDFLVKRSGSSIWQGMAIGGSFGLGKFAPFTMSPLRTVAYSTLNDNGTYGFAMKAILQSYYSSNNQINAGTWFFWDKSDNKGITDKSIIEKLGMLRDEQGTDIYIIGFDDDEGFVSGESQFNLDVAREVAENYFLAIKENYLVCEIFDGTDTIKIDSSSIDKYLTLSYTLFSKKENGTYSKSPMRYSESTGALFMQAYNSNEHNYQLNIKHIGKVDLYLKIKPKNFEDKSMKMNHIFRSRKLLMKVDAKSYPSISSDPFSGVMIVREDEGNKLLVQAETARHDKWDHKEVRDNIVKKKVREALDDFRLQLEEIFQKLAANRRGLREFPDSRFLPFSSSNMDGEDEKSTLTTKYEKSKKTKINPTKIKPIKKPITIEISGEGGSGEGSGGGGKGGGKGPGEGGGTSGTGEGKDSIEKFVKNYRSISTGTSTYDILLDMEDKLEGSISAKVYARSEDKLKEMPIEVLEAKNNSGVSLKINYSIEDGLKSSSIDLGLLNKNKNNFTIKVKNQRKLALELKLDGELDEQ